MINPDIKENPNVGKIIDKLLKEIFAEDDYLKRFKLIEQLDLFARAIVTMPMVQILPSE